MSMLIILSGGPPISDKVAAFIFAMFGIMAFTGLLGLACLVYLIIIKSGKRPVAARTLAIVTWLFTALSLANAIMIIVINEGSMIPLPLVIGCLIIGLLALLVWRSRTKKNNA